MARIKQKVVQQHSQDNMFLYFQYEFKLTPMSSVLELEVESLFD